MIVSEPVYTVTFTPTATDLMRTIMWAGHGRYSYCHPEMGLNPSWFAVKSWVKFSCGIFVLLIAVTAVFALHALRTKRPFVFAALRARVVLHQRFRFRLKYMWPFGFRGEEKPMTCLASRSNA